MKKLIIAAAISLASFGANASCYGIVSGVLDDAGTALSQKASSASAIGLYIATCERYKQKAIYGEATKGEAIKSLEETEKRLNDVYGDVGTINFIVGMRTFNTFKK